MSYGALIFSPNDLSLLKSLPKPTDPISSAQLRVKEEEKMAVGAGIKTEEELKEEQGRRRNEVREFGGWGGGWATLRS